METARFTIVAAENPYAENLYHRRITADIVLIDRSCDRTAPVLYALKQDLLTAIPDPRDAFVLLGPILEHSRDRKEIFLGNQALVNYNRLITFTGPKSGHFQVSAGEEFCPGAVLAIIDAMRCAPIRLELTQTAFTSSKPSPNLKPRQLTLNPRNIVSAFLLHEPDQLNPHVLTDQWGQVRIKLYEVRL